MNSTPIVPGYILLMYVGYKYSSRKFLLFIATGGSGSTEPGDPYLYRFPDNCHNVYICPVIYPLFIGRYFNDFNSI